MGQRLGYMAKAFFGGGCEYESEGKNVGTLCPS